MKTPEYREGPEALESSKTLATAILQAPPKKKKKQTKKSASVNTTLKSDKDGAPTGSGSAQHIKSLGHPPIHQKLSSSAGQANFLRATSAIVGDGNRRRP
jgi:hypothetical protein